LHPPEALHKGFWPSIHWEVVIQLQSEESKNETKVVKSLYDRISVIYDFLEIIMEFFLSRRRRELWQRVPAGTILEVGVGTGKNMRFYSESHFVTGIDISDGMLRKARSKAEKLKLQKNITLEVGDVQRLPYLDSSFDSVVSTCVFCSVPDAVKGLKEIRRVLKPGGKLFMLEHVLSHHHLAKRIMTALDFIPAHIWGAHINRETVQNLKQAGFEKIEDKNLFYDVLKVIVAE